MVPGLLRRNRQAAAAVTETVYHPSLWGAALWKVLHTLAEKPTTTLTSWVALIDQLKSALPCPECRGHFATFVANNPPPSEGTVREWLLALHNDVNRRNIVAPWTLTQLADNYSGADMSVVRENLPTVKQYVGGVVVSAIEGMMV
jgi:hypothetical protein